MTAGGPGLLDAANPERANPTQPEKLRLLSGKRTRPGPVRCGIDNLTDERRTRQADEPDTNKPRTILEQAESMT